MQEFARKKIMYDQDIAKESLSRPFHAIWYL